jgi:ubiquinone/menaquinone biosynthesis C-methylase UbiE
MTCPDKGASTGEHPSRWLFPAAVRSALPGSPPGLSQPDDPTIEYLPPWTSVSLAAAGHRVDELVVGAAELLAPAPDLAVRRRVGRAYEMVREAAVLLGSRGRSAEDERYLPTPGWARTLTAVKRGLAGPQPALGRPELLRALGWCAHYRLALFGHGDLPGGLGLRPAAPLDVPLYGSDLAASYERFRPASRQWTQAARRFAERCAAGADVVEIGPGTGRLAVQLTRAARSYTGIDASPAMLTVLHHHLTRLRPPRTACPVRLIPADGLHLPLPTDSADLVVEHESLFLVEEPLLAVAEAARVLRPGGTLVRLVIRSEPDDQAADAIRQAFRRGALAGRPPFPICGKSSDARITGFLARCGLPTDARPLANWTDTVTAGSVIAGMRARAWPYLSAVSDNALRRGAAEADRARAVLGLGVSDRLTTRRELVAQTTWFPGAGTPAAPRRAHPAQPRNSRPASLPTPQKPVQ